MLIVKIRDKVTEVKITETERVSPNCRQKAVYCLIPDLYVASVEEASPWVRSDKTDWSSEARSNRVTRVGGALEQRLEQ